MLIYNSFQHHQLSNSVYSFKARFYYNLFSQTFDNSVFTSNFVLCYYLQRCKFQYVKICVKLLFLTLYFIHANQYLSVCSLVKHGKKVRNQAMWYYNFRPMQQMNTCTTSMPPIYLMITQHSSSCLFPASLVRESDWQPWNYLCLITKQY